MTATPATAEVAPDRLALIARTLQIPPATWLAFVTAYEASPARPPAGESAAAESAAAETDRCVAALAGVYREVSPHEAPLPAGASPRACAACRLAAVRPAFARRSPPPAPPLVYGRCARCGHGALWSDDAEASAALYDGAGYYSVRDGRGAGYDDYGDDDAYRVGKGARLIARLERGTPPPIHTLLEIGCGFGYTRAAAERAGWSTAGVDISAHAVAAADRRYGQKTFHGTLAQAVASSDAAIAPGRFGVVLYQFVLEHVADPAGELALARERLLPGGSLVLLVPSMETAEVEVFGASYRSFRADHLHVFSRASLAAMLGRAGFAVREIDSHCNIHLFEGLLSPRALAHLYDSGRGPDLFVRAERQP